MDIKKVLTCIFSKTYNFGDIIPVSIFLEICNLLHRKKNTENPLSNMYHNKATPLISDYSVDPKHDIDMKYIKN